MNEAELFTAVADLAGKISLELMFAEPGKDIGLLPLNNLLGQMEELVQSTPTPPPLDEAIKLARSWIDRMFDGTAQFDAATLAQFGHWAGWMESALDAVQQGRPWPEPPGASADSAATAVAAGAAPTAAAPPPAPIANEDMALVLNVESDGELLREFTNESHEHLQNIELGVLILEENPSDIDTLNSIFRAFHTFKGGSGFLNLNPINALAHELESLLDLARQQKLAITSEIIDIILSGGDTLKQFIASMVRQLDGLQTDGPVIIPTQGLHLRIREVLSGQAAASAALRAGSANADETIPPASFAAAPVPALAPPLVREAATLSGSFKRPADGPVVLLETLAQATGATVVKVDTLKLDSLVDLVGELVIAQSQVSQDASLQSLQSPLLARNLAQVGRITTELQRTAMSLRMVPIRQTFQKMTRLVRDSAARLGKQIELTMSGEDTELDRIIVEEISDPLIHMVRNSVDHGIEKPEVRQEHGKPACGTVHLAAYHQGGSIVIEIKDDGGGLNTDRILAKAIEKGIVPCHAQLGQKEIFGLIFEPGFSTAESITDISGRGVGLDVVRRNIDKLHGKIEIASTLGQGSTFTISLPLTLAIIDGLIVGVGRERFILPTLSVRESFRPKPEMISTLQERGEMINVRGHLSPLLRLSEYFNIPALSTDPMQGIVVVVEAGGSDRCLLVDQLIGKQEVVIKSLGETFKDNHALAGAAILGDGRVGLILEVNYLVRLPRSPLAKAA